MNYLLTFLAVLVMSSPNFSQAYGFESSLTTSVDSKKIWNIWIDVDNWSVWDSGLKSVNHTGMLKEHSKGFLIPDRGPKAKFKIVEWEEGKSYTMKTNIPFGGLYVKRFISKKNGVTEFTHQVWFTGMLKKLFFRKFGARYEKMLPDVLLKIKTIAEA